MKNSGTICYDERSLLYGRYSEPAIRRAEIPCINRIISIFLIRVILYKILQTGKPYMYMQPWFYMLGAKKNRLFKYSQHIIWLKTFQVYIPVS